MQTNKKKRVLISGEASYIMSGFGTYNYELLSRLHQTGKYDLAEFATYGYVNDPRDRNVKWRIYANAVKEEDPRYKAYNANPINQFGLWRLDRVLLDHKSCILIDVRDPWMLIYQNESPLRPFIHWAISPTVDSSPHKPEWLDIYAQADGVLSYSDWNLQVLKDEGNDKIKLHRPAPPGVDLDIFCPVKDLKQHRLDLGVQPDINIIGTVMRNQRRKLYPDLLHAFKLFLEKCKQHNNDELAKKTYLYIHTSYPDIGWNFPELLKETGIGHKVLFTYICRECKKYFCAFFQDARTVCPFCSTVAGVLPCVSQGVSRKQLADIYRLFDVYVQYSVCEGIGIPQIEAAACGVPVMAVDFSAMKDVVRNTSGIPLKVEREFLESDIGAYRAMPDNKYCAEQFYKFFTKPQSYRKKICEKARKGAVKNYSWDNNAKIWEEYIDSVQLKDLQGKWDAPPRLHNPPRTIPSGLNNVQFIKWIFETVYGEPHRLNTRQALSWLGDINHGVSIINNKPTAFNREMLFKKVLQEVDNRNICEKGRCGLLPLKQEDYIHYAHMKEQLNASK